MAFENLKKHVILALLVFNIAFWLYIYIASGEKEASSLCFVRPLRCEIARTVHKTLRSSWGEEE